MNRNLIVTAALDLLQREGLDALSMRTLADRLGVKAASLYWHVRDRRELLELLAAAILAEVSPPARGREWRADALAICAGLEAVLEGGGTVIVSYSRFPRRWSRAPSGGLWPGPCSRPASARPNPARRRA